MTPTDLRQNFLPVKRVGLHYTHFRNHLPLFMRLPGSQNPKNCQNSHRVAKVGLATFRLFSTQLVINGNATQAEISRAFGVPLVTVKRYVKLYREGGAAAFFAPAKKR